MLLLRNRYPDDENVQVLWADSVLLMTPWEYYDSTKGAGGEKLKESMVPVFETLKRIVALPKPHLLALHLWIHLVEQSTRPQQGEAAADALVAAIRDDGTSHLIHMPSHIYFRTGRYKDCISSSQLAIVQDETYLNKCLKPYLPTHNQAMFVACSMARGDLELAKSISPPLFQAEPLSASYPAAIFPPPKELVFARFGEWPSILSLPSEDGILKDPQYPYLRAQSLYARTLGLLWTGEANNAKLSMEDFQREAAGVPPDSLSIEHVFYQYHREIVQLLNLTLWAAFETNGGNYEQALIPLRAAVKLQDSFTYMEPENHYIPLRQCLAAVLLKLCEFKKTATSGTVECLQSVQEYHEDLAQHPHNAFALQGLQAAVDLLGVHATGVSGRLPEVVRGETELLSQMGISGSCCEVGLCKIRPKLRAI